MSKICLANLQKVAKKFDVPLLKEELQDILEVMEQKIANRGGVIGDETLKDLYQEAIKITEQAKIAAALQKRNQLINARAYSNIMTAVKADPANPGKALSALMVGDARRGLFSVDARQQSIMTDHVGMLAADLRKNDLLALFKSNELDAEIYRELFDGLGSSGSKEARQIAESVRRVQKRLLDRKNRNGANIGELENYVVRQSHDAILIRAAGKQQWIDEVKQLINKERTFESKPPRMSEDEFLGNIYDNLATGNHQKTNALYGDDGTIDQLSEFRGPRNLAKRLSSQRIIHFRDGKTAFEYAQKFSRMSFSESVLNSITHDAQSIGLMEVFGTNPQRMFEVVIADLQQEAKPDAKAFGRIRLGRLKNQFAELDGTTRARGAGQPVWGLNTDFAGIAAGARMIQNMAKLGFATISSISDLGTKAAFINSNTERGIFGSYAVALKDTFRLFNSKEQQELAFLLNVGVENMLGDVHARFGANDSGPGKIATAHQMFFRLNGMAWWNNAQKTGIARMLSADLANYSRKGFDKVPRETQRLLRLYRIGEVEWSLLRTLDNKAVDGRRYVIPNQMDELSDDVIDPIIRDRRNTLNVTDAMRQEFKDELRTKFAAYLTDSADTAIPTPGARERAFMNQGLPRGTVGGEAFRLVMQLKGFPITYVMKAMDRQIASGGVVGLAKMMVGTTMLGYLANATKDVLKGRSPQDVFNDDYTLNRETLTRAFVQGGGAGIYGDFIFGEFNRFGQSPLETFAGPTLGTANDLLKIFAKFRDGDDATAASVRLALRNTPFINLFYSKLALDYLFVYELQEFANPGYLQRMERRMQRETGQEFYFPPSQAVR
jgi:hypothetical protein